MNYDEFKNEIITSKPEDWIYDDALGLYVYKNDIKITIQSDREGILNDSDDEFYEPWLEKYSDSKGHKSIFFFRFNGVIIDTFYTVAVDGYRQLIPYPESINNLVITQEKENIARILNIPYSGYDFDEYLRRAGISISE